MNTINRIKPLQIPNNSFEKFRENQYNLIPDFAKLCIEYLSSLNNNYLKLVDISFEEKIGYKDIYNSEINILHVRCEDFMHEDKKPKTFFKLYVPKLIESNYFFLNNNYYVPTVYLLDKPIVFKKVSCLISCLFNSMTFNFKRNVVTFKGVNIPIAYFLLMLIYANGEIEDTVYKLVDIVKQDINKKFQFKDTKTEEDVLNYFSSNLNCKKDFNVISNHFDQLMFDPYTKYLYQQYYNIEDINIFKLIEKIVEIYDYQKDINFVDLSNKRLVFVELLMLPLFKKISHAANQAIRGFRIGELKIGMIDIIKNFNIYLKSNFLYDTCNLYSCILQHKISMISPASERAPSSVASIHDSHFGRICPITVSSQDPGKTVSMVPETKVNFVGQIL